MMKKQENLATEILRTALKKQRFLFMQIPVERYTYSEINGIVIPI